MAVTEKNIQIRSIVAKDLAAVRQLWSTIPETPLTPSDSVNNLTNYLERNPGISHLAEIDTVVIGAILGGHDGARGYLRHLAVHGDYRGLGIGNKLVRSVIEQLKSIGIIKCTVFALTGNQSGTEFWINSGWHERIDLKTFSKKL